MKNPLLITAFALLAGCAQLPFMQPPAAPEPATPVFFQPFSAALDQPALTTIAAAANQANAEPHARVYVTGAADGTGSVAANRYLSKTRAQVVADALESDGVAPARIHIRGAGEIIAPGGPGAQSSRRALIQIGG